MADSQTGRTKRASARREGTAFRHSVSVRDHQVTVDEPLDTGGQDGGPDPQELLAASLASCTAITMEMYAARKGWEIGPVEVAVEFNTAERGSPTTFELVVRLPDDVPEEQVERLRAISERCPVHRALEGEVIFRERIERVHMAV